MSDMEDNDVYWNSTTKKCFDMNDDDEFGANSILFETDRSRNSLKTNISLSDNFTHTSVPAAKKKPLTSLVTEESLDLILTGRPKSSIKPELSQSEELKLLRRKLKDIWTPDSATQKDAVKKIMLEQPYNLQIFRSLDSKRELLQEAVDLGDGNVILVVVLFLAESLKKTLFCSLINNYPIAISHYVAYLITRSRIVECTDFLTMLNMHTDAAMYFYQLCACSILPNQTTLDRLDHCLKKYFENDIKDKEYVKSYMKLLKWQLSVRFEQDASLLRCLEYVCTHLWPPGQSITQFCQDHGIRDKQYKWTVLFTRSSLESWDSIEQFFITKNLFGRRKLDTVIPPDKLISELYDKNSPVNLLAVLLELVDNLELRLELAKKFSCHKIAIDVYKATKNMSGLAAYKATLTPQTDHYIYAESVLMRN